MSTVQEFGYLHYPWEFETKYFAVELLPNHKELKDQMKERAINHYVYPWLVTTNTINIETNELQPIKGTTRTAEIWKPPMSHRMIIKNPTKIPWRQEGLAALQFISFLAGTPLTFSDLWMEGTICVRETSGVSHAEWDRPKLMDLAHKYFITLEKMKYKNPIDKRLARMVRRQTWINSLYLHNKAHCRTWEWEHFLLEFMSLDAIWSQLDLREKKYGKEKGRIQKKRYSGQGFNRMYTMAKEYGLVFSFVGKLDKKGQRWPSEAFVASEIVNLRNNLIHQSLWDGDLPGVAAKSPIGTWAPYYLSDNVQYFSHFQIEGAVAHVL